MNNLYAFLQSFSVVGSIAFTIFWAKKYKASMFKVIPIAVISNLLTYALIFLLAWIENGFTNFGAQNAVRAYVFTILICWLESKLFKMDLLTVMDFQAITVPLSYGIGHFACLGPNCCAGFYYQEGTVGYKIAQALTGTAQLPNQIFESVTALTIFTIIVVIAIKTKFKATGYMFALFYVLFGGTRFLWEFLRDNEKVIVFGPMNGATTINGYEAVWGISSLALWALAIFAVGVIMFAALIIHHSNKEQPVESAE